MIWKKAYLETRILSADPVELVNILYEYATMSVQDARAGLASGDVVARSQAVSKAIAIIGELESSLNREQGGEIAANLGRLYRYMRDRITQANVSRTDEPMAEVEALLKTLGEGWQEVSRSNPMPVSMSTNHMAAAAGSWSGSTTQSWGAPPVDSLAGHTQQSWSA